MYDQAIVEGQTAVNVQYGPANPNHIKIIRGSTDILLIAPHACIRNGEPKDDENTGPITEIVARELGCSAIINTYYHKPKKPKYAHGLATGNLDLNVIKDAKLVPGYLDGINAIVDAPGKTTVIWIHGADTDKAMEVAREGDYEYQPEEIQAFLGYGQGKNPATGKGNSRFTAEQNTVERLRDALTRNGMATVITDNGATNYRGRSLKGMNQWLFDKKRPYEQLESIQIEIRKAGFRDLHQNIEKTAGILIEALSQEALVPIIPDETEADNALVDLAYNHLRGIFAKHIHEAMLQAGRYLVKTFFGTFENAREWKKIRNQSFNRLKERLTNSSGNVPKKTWVYDAIKLAVDDHFYNLENGELFRAYGKLGHSQKLRLAYVRHKETKEKLIQEVADSDEPVTDRKLRKRISTEKSKLPKKKRKLTIFQAIENPAKLPREEAKEARSFDNIAGLAADEIKTLIEKHNDTVAWIESEIDNCNKEIAKLEKHLDNYRLMEKRLIAAKGWREELDNRKASDKPIELPQETPRLKKLRDAVQFMCFWKRFNYAHHCLSIGYHYIPIEEATELQLQAMLQRGQCDLKATWKFETIGKGKKIKWLSEEEVQKRIDKGTFWLSREKYDLYNDPKFYDYK